MAESTKEFEKHVRQIMEEALADNEPVSREEAEEMAEMEIKAKGIKRYEQSAKPRKRNTKERKVDTEKQTLLNVMHRALESIATNFSTKTETELSFTFNGNDYTIKLVKHRKPKG